MTTIVGPSRGMTGEEAAGAHVLSLRAEPAKRTRRRVLASIDACTLVFVALLQTPMGFGYGALGIILFVGLSGALLLVSEKLAVRFGSLVRFAEIVLVPVILALSSVLTSLALQLTGTNIAKANAVALWLLASVCVIAGRVALSWDAARVPPNRITRTVGLASKRATDVAIAGTLLVVTTPIAIPLAFAIWFTDRGPIVFRCRRVGEGGVEFDMLKFRKMARDAEGPPLTAPDDDRFTRVGQFLARTKLDELPQLWNVIRGQMSLVGPRPEDPEFVALHPASYETITTIRPGITGLCQLAFAKESQIIGGEDPVQVYAERFLPQKLSIDLLYVRHRTFALDLRILCWTAIVLLRKDVAVHRETGQLTFRRRQAAVEAA